MTPERYRKLDTNQGLRLTSMEVAEGWRFCACEWDGMLVNINDREGEGRFCYCYQETTMKETLWDKFLNTSLGTKLLNRYWFLQLYYQEHEWFKQLLDQSAHLLVGIIFVPLLSWLIALALPQGIAIWMGGGAVLGAWVVREIDQWPSTRKWDPPLDWFFEALGIYFGVVLYL